MNTSGNISRLNSNNMTPLKGVHELWDRVAKEWTEIPPETCQKLIESMPRRIQAVLEAKGGYTKY